MATMKELRQEVKEQNTKFGNFYSIRSCITCGVKFAGGTNKKRCMGCDATVSKRQAQNNTKSIQWKESLPETERHCAFCKTADKLHVHHIDRDRTHNEPDNFLLVCDGCHHVLHGKLYRPLLRRVFLVLMNERYTYEEMADYFGTSKQNVYAILKRRKKLST